MRVFCFRWPETSGDGNFGRVFSAPFECCSSTLSSLRVLPALRARCDHVFTLLIKKHSTLHVLQILSARRGCPHSQSQSVTVCHSGGGEFNISSGPEKAPTGAPDGSLKSPCRRQCECRGGVACFCILKKSFSHHMRGNLQLREKGPQRRVLRSLHFAYRCSRRLVEEPVPSAV